MQQQYILNQFKIYFKRIPRFFSYTDNSKFVIIITFFDLYTDRELLQITTNEKEYFRIITDLFDFSYDTIESNNLYFNHNVDGSQYVISLENIYFEYPVEEDLNKFTIYSNDPIQGYREKLTTICTYPQIEEMVYIMYLLIEDLDLRRLGNSLLLDLIDEY